MVLEDVYIILTREVPSRNEKCITDYILVNRNYCGKETKVNIKNCNKTEIWQESAKKGVLKRKIQLRKLGLS